MSPVTHFSLLALASAVLATPFHGHAHQHLHARGDSPAGYGSPAGYSSPAGYDSSTGSSAAVSAPAGTGAPYPYPTGNGTSPWGSTGLPYASSPSAPAYAPSSQASPNTASGNVVYHTETAYTTLTVAYQSSAPGYGSVAAAGYGSSSGAACAAVTVTATQRVTQYVTAGAPASSSAAVPSYPASSSSAAAPASNSAPAYTAPAVSSSAEAHAPSYNKQPSSPASSPATAPSYADKQENVGVSASVPPLIPSGAMGNAPSTPAASSSSGGKRGLAYNDVSMTTCFAGSNEISWAYNWGSSSGGLNSEFMFIPTLWGNASQFTDSWSDNAKQAIGSGSTHLFSFNEPDLPAQANMEPAAAVDAYCTYMNPFQGQAKLCAPAVTNGGGSMGLSWLQSFLSSCGSECHIDCINIHWYDSASNVDYFKSHVQQAISIANGKPVYVSEFGATGSDDEIAEFLKEVMPWMDSNDQIAGYSYYMAADGLLNTGSEPSSYGSVFKSYTS